MALGTACIIKGHTILTGRNAALMVAYAGLQGVFDKYRDQVKEAIGEEKEARYYLESQGSERVDDGSDPAVIRMATASPYAKWFDESSKEWHRNHDYNLMTLHTVQNYMNDLLRLRARRLAARPAGSDAGLIPPLATPCQFMHMRRHAQTCHRRHRPPPRCHPGLLANPLPCDGRRHDPLR